MIAGLSPTEEDLIASGAKNRELSDAANARILKIYGSFEQYEQFKHEVGIAPDHAATFERYDIILQPNQMRFAVLARQADFAPNPREVGKAGAKGSGKTYGIFAQLLDDCLRFPGIKVLYLRKTESAAKEQLADLIHAVFGKVQDKKVNTERILFGNGSQIIIGGFKDDNQALSYQGIEYDILYIAEATQISKHTYTVLRSAERSSKVFNGVPFRPRTYIDGNPLGIGHAWVKERFVDPERMRQAGKPLLPKTPNTRFLFSYTEDNVFLNPEYIENLDQFTGAEYRAYRLGDWDVSAGAYFEAFRHNIHVIDPIDDLSWMVEVWCAKDYGFQHWNVILLFGKDGDGNTYVIDELAHRKRVPSEIAPDYHAWLWRYGLVHSNLNTALVGADLFNRTGAASLTLAEQYAQLGMPMIPAETSPGSRVAGAHLISKLLGDPDRKIPPTLFITSRCPRLITCLPYMERDPHNSEDVRKVDTDAHGVGGDDPYDVLRYGVYRPHLSTMS